MNLYTHSVKWISRGNRKHQTTEINYPRYGNVKICIKFDLFLFNVYVSEKARPSIGIMRFNDVTDLGNGIL